MCNGGKPHPPPPVACPGSLVTVGLGSNTAARSGPVRITISRDGVTPRPQGSTMLLHGSRMPLLGAPRLVANGQPQMPISVKVTVPNTGDLSGQMITLPSSFSSKLNFSKPLNLKLAGMTYHVPPQCVFVGKTGVRVFLPSQKDTENAMKAATSGPIAISSSIDEESQELHGISMPTDLASAEKALRESPNKSQDVEMVAVNGTDVTPSGKKKQTARVGKYAENKYTASPMHTLTGGQDCLLHIFQYLPLGDLIR